MKSMIAVTVLALAASASYGQAASGADDAASGSKHKIAKKFKAYKAKHPASAATNPETSPDKKGGQ